MAKRKKKDRFYVEQLYEWPDKRRAWFSWSQKGKSKQEITFVKVIINTMYQDSGMTAMQCQWLDTDHCKISFVVYRNWP